MIEWTIKSALDSEIFHEVIVSSEDAEILQIANDMGVKIHKRDMELSFDSVTVEEVCLEVIEKFYEKNYLPDNICCLYATSPLRSAKDIIETVALVTEGQHEKAYAVTSFDLPVHQAVRIEEDSGSVISVFPDLINKRSEDVASFWVDNGSTYVARTLLFLQNPDFLSGNVGLYKMPKVRSVDIDTEYDYKQALYFALNIEERKDN